MSLNINNKFNIKFLLLVLLLVIIALVVIFLIASPNNKTEYFLKLKGDSDIAIYTGSDYIDPGYEAYDSKGKTYDASEVSVIGNVNSNVSGTYTITYEFKEIKLERTITVISNKDKITILGLYGDSIIYVPLGSEFKDPKYYVIDSDYSNEEMINKVSVTGEVNTNIAGTYKITYTLVNNQGITITKERIVIVTSADFALDYEPKNLTNQKVKIYGYISNNYFDYILLPNNEKKTERSFSYIVNSNGKYKFITHLQDGTHHEEIIEIKNIDTNKPTGSCQAEVESNTNVFVTAGDDSGIAGYIYHIDEFVTNTLTSSSYQSNRKAASVSVEVKDKAGNSNTIECTVKIKEPPKPQTNKTEYTIFVGDSRTEDMCLFAKSHMKSTDQCVAEVGKSLSWFKQTAVPKVNNILNSNPNRTYNIIIDLGVNGLTPSSASNYAEEYNKLKNNAWQKHNVVVTSVTPVHEARFSNSYGRSNFNSQIKEFNNNLQNNLSSNILYCDIYNDVLSLIQNTQNVSPDGLHYTTSGYIVIYNLKNDCLNSIK